MRLEWHRWSEDLGHTLCNAGFNAPKWSFSDRPPKRGDPLCHWCWPVDPWEDGKRLAEADWSDLDKKIEAACRMHEYMTGRSG